MTRSRRLIVGYLLLAPVTVAAFLAALVITGFLACGISGCSGGGFGPSFSPVEAQVGLVVCGATLLPFTVLLLRRQRWPVAVVAGADVVLAGALLAMAVLDLGPDGCPADQARATVGPDDFDAGAATCSADDDALPPPAGRAT